MDRRIVPAKNISGGLRLPGDKSISHRYALLSAMAEGQTSIRNYSPGADCASTLTCLEQLGVVVSRRRNGSGPERERSAAEELVIEGRGLGGFQPPRERLQAGNSGSTIRMLSGLLAGHLFRSVISGDESLERRPMKRIMEPLQQMGAQITARDGNYPPLQIAGMRLRGIHYRLPVASAQVKSCVLLAGLLAEGETAVTEPVQTRDHTEIALAEFGATMNRGRRTASVQGGHALKALKLAVPGDISSAAFFLCAALLFPSADLYLQDVGLNPTRTALLDFLSGMGAQVKMLNIGETTGELVGDIHVTGGPLRGGSIAAEMVAALIDEIPVLAVLGTQTEEGLTLRNAEELRLKESDRIATIAENLRRMGAEVEVRPDGFDIPGRQRLCGAELDSFGDHRIAMAFTVAALVAGGESLLHNCEAASVSFPEFFDELEKITER
jgi:3-phosphoshikimate 1-carboxyvinyltransferase